MPPPGMRPLLRNVIGIAGFFVVWEVAVRTGLVSRLTVPPASVVLQRLAGLLGDASFLRDVLATVLAWAIALGIALAVAVPAGLLAGGHPGPRGPTRPPRRPP